MIGWRRVDYASRMRFVLATLLVLSACSSKKQAAPEAPPCDKVVGAMLDLTKQAMPGHGDMEMGNKKQMVAECEKRNLTAEQKRCIVAAKDLNALATCTAKPPAAK